MVSENCIGSGGGISGYGEVCGSVTGAVICIGLTMGTCGTESVVTFDERRVLARGIVKEFMKSFEGAWGSVQCRDLRAMDEGTRPPVGRLRPRTSPRNLCDNYVDWSVQRTNDILYKAKRSESR
ncbi:MAG: hypothetical protein DRO87_08880 [Candidatus Thorarchaeota archaeon]|nr:MAG: hypothetical protein DRO87_08880 [Candidatus Thorarchaeota archaeon]RLI55960.1 MAG: hypothetical protein DRP09_08110 [Candidatus Thorarchaeota archaeon]